MQRLLTAIRGGHWMRLAAPLIGACALVALLVTNVAADTTPATYYACVNIKTGSIYMVNAGDTCQKGYTPISWNQVGPQGPQGSAGPVGPQGPQGQQGPAGPTQTLTISEVVNQIDIPQGYGFPIEAFCPTGTLVTGGGFYIQSETANVLDIGSVPDPSSNGWIARADNPGPESVSLTVYALCASLA